METPNRRFFQVAGGVLPHFFVIRRELTGAPLPRVRRLMAMMGMKTRALRCGNLILDSSRINLRLHRGEQLARDNAYQPVGEFVGVGRAFNKTKAIV